MLELLTNERRVLGVLTSERRVLPSPRPDPRNKGEFRCELPPSKFSLVNEDTREMSLANERRVFRVLTNKRPVLPGPGPRRNCPPVAGNARLVAPDCESEVHRDP